jgi:hypothetical protein
VSASSVCPARTCGTGLRALNASAITWRGAETVRRVFTTVMASLLAVLTSTAAGAAQVGHSALPRCPGVREGVLAADVQAVVYKAPVTAGGLIGDVFACAYGARRSYDLGPTP